MTIIDADNSELLKDDDVSNKETSSLSFGRFDGVGGAKMASEEVSIARDVTSERNIAETEGGAKVAPEVVESESISEDSDSEMRLIEESDVTENRVLTGKSVSTESSDAIEEEDGTIDYDVEMVLAKQNTHDLFCPNCHSCITRRVILQRRKRKVRFKQRNKKATASEILDAPISSSDNVPTGESDRDESNILFRCLSCFTFFIPSGTAFKFFGDSKLQQENKNEEEVFDDNSCLFSIFSAEARNTRIKTNTVPELESPSVDKIKEHVDIMGGASLSSATMISDSSRGTANGGDIHSSLYNEFEESSKIVQPGGIQSIQAKSSSAVFEEKSGPLVTSKPSFSSSKRQDGSLFREIGKRISKVKDSIIGFSTPGKGSIVDSSNEQVSFNYNATEVEEPFLLDAGRRKVIIEREFDEPFSSSNYVKNKDETMNLLDGNWKKEIIGDYEEKERIPVPSQQDISFSSETTKEISKIDDAMEGLSTKGREKVMEFFSFLVSSKYATNEDNQIAVLDERRKKLIVGDLLGDDNSQIQQNKPFSSETRKGPLKIADVVQFLVTSGNKTAIDSSTSLFSSADHLTDEDEQIPLVDGRRKKPVVEASFEEDSVISDSSFSNESYVDPSNTNDSNQVLPIPRNEKDNDSSDVHFSSFDDETNKDVHEEDRKKPVIEISEDEGKTLLDEEGTKQDDPKLSNSGSTKASSPDLVTKEDEQTALVESASEEIGTQHYIHFVNEIRKGVLKIEDVIKILSTPKNTEAIDSSNAKKPMIGSALDSKDASAISTPLLYKSGDLLFPNSASIKSPTSKLTVNSDEIQLHDSNDSLSQKMLVLQNYQTADNDNSESLVIVVESASINAKQTRAEISTDVSLVTCIVYGGLVEAITSLGVVSSAAGAGSSTVSTFGLGLANLIGGFFVLCHNILDLRHDHNSRDSDQESDHNRYMVLKALRLNFALYATVIAFSYVLFGALPPVIYGFSFHKSDDRDFKFLAVAGVSVLCIGLLAAGKTYANAQRNYLSNIIYFVALAFGSSGASFVVGDLFLRLLQHLGWSLSIDGQPGWSSF